MSNMYVIGYIGSYDWVELMDRCDELNNMKTFCSKIDAIKECKAMTESKDSSRIIYKLVPVKVLDD